MRFKNHLALIVLVLALAPATLMAGCGQSAVRPRVSVVHAGFCAYSVFAAHHAIHNGHKLGAAFQAYLAVHNCRHVVSH